MARVKELQKDLFAIPIQKKNEVFNNENLDIAKKIVRDNILFPALARIFRPMLRLEAAHEEMPDDSVIESDTSEEFEDEDVSEAESLDTKMDRYFKSLPNESVANGMQTEATETKNDATQTEALVKNDRNTQTNGSH